MWVKKHLLTILFLTILFIIYFFTLNQKTPKIYSLKYSYDTGEEYSKIFLIKNNRVFLFRDGTRTDFIEIPVLDEWFRKVK